MKLTSHLQCLISKNFVFILFLFSSIEVGISIGVHLLSPASLTLLLLGPLLLLLFRLQIKEFLTQKYSLILSLTAFGFIIFLSMIASTDHAIAIRFSVKYFAQIMIFMGFLLYFHSRKNEGKQVFLRGILYFSLLNGIVNILEKLSISFVVKILHQIHPGAIFPNALRTSGLFQNPNTSGAFEVLGFICLLVYGAEILTSFRIRIAAYILLISGIMLSQSINSLGNLFFLSILAILFSQKKNKHTKKILFVGFLLSFSLLAVLLKERITLSPSTHVTIGETLRSQDSLNQRLQIWHAAITSIRTHPIIGLGAGVFIFKTQILGKFKNYTFLIPSGQFNAHNLELNMAAGFGLLGLSAFLFFMFMVARSISDPDSQNKKILFLALITLQQLDCFLDSSFAWEIVFWGLLALIATDFSDKQPMGASASNPSEKASNGSALAVRSSYRLAPCLSLIGKH